MYNHKIYQWWRTAKKTAAHKYIGVKLFMNVYSNPYTPTISQDM